MDERIKTNFSQQDYDWVRQQISLQHPRGISRRDLEKISRKESKRLGFRPRDEKPPGRDKIIQILKEGEGINWAHNKSRGGRGNKAEYVAITHDTFILLEKTVNYIAYEEMTARLNTLYKKREAKFGRVDYFEFVKIRRQLLSYPMKVYHYGAVEKGLNKDVMFNSLVSRVKNQLDKLKKIENSQMRLDRNFADIVKNIEKLNESNIDQVVLDSSSNIKEHFAPRNTLRRLLKIKT